jgi:hypothetical protein
LETRRGLILGLVSSWGETCLSVEEERAFWLLVG